MAEGFFPFEDPETEINSYNNTRNDGTVDELSNASDYNKSKKIHKNLKKAVTSFSYWASNIGNHIKYCQKLQEMEKKLEDRRGLNTQILTELQLRGSTKDLHKEIERFNKGDKKQSKTVKRFFELRKEQKELNEGYDLCVEHFKDITEEEIDGICSRIRAELIKIPEKKTGNEATRPNGLIPETFKRNIKMLMSAVKKYQKSTRIGDELKRIIASIKDKIDKIKSKITRIENIQSDEPSNHDTTNFVAAEVGFLIDVRDKPLSEYYHFPVTFPNKNICNIYDLRNADFNYVGYKTSKRYYGNYIVDDVLIKHTTSTHRTQAEPRIDYHSEAALLFLCTQRSFQEEMIDKLIKSLQERRLKLSKIKKLIIEIHSTKDICSDCFRKAEYLMNWKEADNLNKRCRFLQKLGRTLSDVLERKRVFNKLQDSFPFAVIDAVIDLEVEIRFSYAKAYPLATKKEHPRFIRLKIDGKEDNLLDCAKALSQYSIITSGGKAKTHENYPDAYDKAVKPATKFEETKN